MKFELINPSDAVFFEAPSLLVAAFAVVYLSPSYGAKEVNGNLEVPIFMFGGAEEWFEKQLNVKDIKETFRTVAKDVAACLKTFHLGKGKRTSINNICKYAHDDAKSLLKAIAKESE